METNKKIARQAGFLYLIVVLAGIFSIAYVPSKLIVWGDASATFNNISENEQLFRLGIYAGIVCYTAFALLPFTLYKLLHSVNKEFAITMVILALVSVPISLYNLGNKIDVLTLISKAEYLNVFPEGQIKGQVLLTLEYYNNGIEIASVFWGLWLLPFGYLVFKSGILPKVLGVFLMMGCFGDLINFTGGFLFTGYRDLGIASYVSLPATIGEIGICLWLLIAGAKEYTTTN